MLLIFDAHSPELKSIQSLACQFDFSSDFKPISLGANHPFNRMDGGFDRMSFASPFCCSVQVSNGL